MNHVVDETYRPHQNSSMTIHQAKDFVEQRLGKMSQTKICDELSKAGFLTQLGKKPTGGFISRIKIDMLGQESNCKPGSRPRGYKKGKGGASTADDTRDMFVGAIEDLITSNVNEKTKKLLIQMLAQRLAEC